MPRPFASLLLLLPLLAACQARIGDPDGTSAGNGSDVHLAVTQQGGDRNQLAVTLPGFDAKVRLPDFNLSGHMDLDGIKLPESSKVAGMDITGGDHGRDGDHGDVQLRFTDKQPPAALIDYYRKAAADAGYAIGAATPGSLAATRGRTRFALAVSPDGAGSRGRIDVTGN